MISVLGMGVAGLCVATSLAERGLQVEVITPEGSPDPASWLAGGMLAPFCEGESAPDLVVKMGQSAGDWWGARVGSLVRMGTLVVAPSRDVSELDRFARATEAHEWVNPAELEPDLETRFARGLFFAKEAHMDPREAMRSLRTRLEAMGVRFHHGPSTGQIIDCTGMAAAAQLPDLRAVRGEMLALYAPDVQLTRTVRLLHPRFPCYIVPRGDGHYMVGATMVESARNGPVSARAVMELLSTAYTVHPAFAEAEVTETGSGLRPSFPDNIPAIRFLGDKIFMNGMYRHGFLTAPALAEELAASLTQEIAHAG
ncbi:FAD-dependent oxidoreductase [Mameliella alba]|uniref:FAD-dependent oxidoreductase n=1 Tax=Mameliella alba TaxID=561184 RepID=UPI000B52CBA0|nr:FAD-dependent oxidoreductase [Mameliella alba]OWV37164.1 FAD-dependent oxidoreductase [Mameliella alba]